MKILLKLIKIIGGFLFFSASITSYSAQNTVNEFRTYNDFSRIEVQNGLSISLIQSANYNLEIIAEDQVSIAEVKSSQKDNTLSIKRQSKGKNFKQIKINIYLPSLSYFRIENGCAAYWKDPFDSENLHIIVRNGSSCKTGTIKVKQNLHVEVENGSSLKGSMEAKNSALEVENGSSCVLDGSTIDLDIKVKNGSSANLKKFILNQGTAELESASALSLPDNGVIDIYKDKSSSIN